MRSKVKRSRLAAVKVRPEASSLSDLAKKGPLGAIFDHRLRAKAYIMLRMARMTHESCTKSLSPTGCKSENLPFPNLRLTAVPDSRRTVRFQVGDRESGHI